MEFLKLYGLGFKLIVSKISLAHDAKLNSYHHSCYKMLQKGHLHSLTLAS